MKGFVGGCIISLLTTACWLVLHLNIVFFYIKESRLPLPPYEGNSWLDAPNPVLFEDSYYSSDGVFSLLE